MKFSIKQNNKINPISYEVLFFVVISAHIKDFALLFNNKQIRSLRAQTQKEDIWLQPENSLNQ